MRKSKKKQNDEDFNMADDNSRLDFDNNENLEDEDMYESDIYDEFMAEMGNDDPDSETERKKNLKKEFYVKRSRFERGTTKIPGIKENRSRTENGYISEELRQHGDKNLYTIFHAPQILPAIPTEMNSSQMQFIVV